MNPGDASNSDAEEKVPIPEQRFNTAPLPGESYREGPYLVFTEAYHLRRGYCCNSDCRHCPYK